MEQGQDVAAATQARYRRPDRLRVGDVAPEFVLERLAIGEVGEVDEPGAPGAGGGRRVRLSAFRGASPVVLFFGSYT